MNFFFVLYLLIFLGFIVLISLLFGHGPNRVTEMACFDANVQ